MTNDDGKVDWEYVIWWPEDAHASIPAYGWQSDLAKARRSLADAIRRLDPDDTTPVLIRRHPASTPEPVPADGDA